LNTYPNQWEDLTLCPEFLNRSETFGLIYIFDDLRKPICEGWTLVHIKNDSIEFENLGYESKIEDELNDLKLFIEVFFESELKLESNPSLFIEKKSLTVKGSSTFMQKIILQITKPNAQECKYLLNERMKFSGYWKEDDSDLGEDPFELIFRYGTAGNFMILPNDYHMYHQYGEILPIFPKTKPWLKEFLKQLRISPFVETDPCTFQIFALSDFLYLTDIFRKHSI